MKYVRDSKTGALLLRDTHKLRDFSEKQNVLEQINALKLEINNLTQTVQTLKARLDTFTTGE